jgi:hypothetical protein
LATSFGRMWKYSMLNKILIDSHPFLWFSNPLGGILMSAFVQCSMVRMTHLCRGMVKESRGNDGMKVAGPHGEFIPTGKSGVLQQ